MMPTVALGSVGQIGVVVRDLQKTIEEFWNTLGIGPWSIWTYDPTVVTDMNYRGEPVEYGIKIALAQAGAVQWEIIEPLWGESIYTEFLRERGEGLHHVAYFVDEEWRTAKDLEAVGLHAILSGFVKGRSFIYFDTKERLGVPFELIARTSPPTVYTRALSKSERRMDHGQGREHRRSHEVHRGNQQA
jgi:methylmalonyl-CoA/ethylmalonyl-CoA epimerase